MVSSASASRAGCACGASIRALSLALLAFPQLAAAEASPAERETARGAMQSGDQLHNAGDLNGALQRYRSAHAIMHVPSTGIAVARTEAELLLLVEARNSAMEVINLPGAAQESAVFARARADAAGLAARLEPLVPSILVDMSPSHISYTIKLDGDELPGAANGLMLKANPGRHVIELSAPGFQSQVQELALTEGETTRLSLTLQRAPMAAAQLLATPGSELEIDPTFADAVQATPTRVVRSAAPAERAHARVLEGSDAPSAGKTRAFVGLTAGGVLLLAGAATGVASVIETARIESRCDAGYCGTNNHGALSTANTLANVSNIALPLGLLGLGYALYEFLSLERAADSGNQASSRYWLKPDAIGVRW